MLSLLLKYDEYVAFKLPGIYRLDGNVRAVYVFA